MHCDYFQSPMKERFSMKEQLKRYMFPLLLILLAILLSEIFFNIVYAILFGIGILLMIIAEWIPIRFLRNSCRILGLFLFALAIFITKSVWLLILFLIFAYWMFKTSSGFEWLHLDEQFTHPFVKQGIAPIYQNIKIVQPQSQQRTILEKRNLSALDSKNKLEYETHDINLVYIGGNNVVDFGHTLLPNQETVVVIRKVFGRIRLILPMEAGISLNISAFSGKVVFEQEAYVLASENFQWTSPDYHQKQRKIRLILSVVTGNVEVSIL